MQFPLQIGRLTGVQASHVQHAPAVCGYNEAYPSSNCCLHKASLSFCTVPVPTPFFFPSSSPSPASPQAKRKASSTMVVERYAPQDGDAATPLLPLGGKTAIVAGHQNVHQHGRGRCLAEVGAKVAFLYSFNPRAIDRAQEPTTKYGAE